MENVRFCVELIASILFVSAIYIKFAGKHFKFSFIHQNQIFVGGLCASLILTLIGYLLASKLYVSPPPASFIILAFGGLIGFFVLVSFISERKKVKKAIYISLKANEYDISTEAEMIGFYDGSIYHPESVLTTKKNEVETTVLVLTSPPKKECDLMLECEKIDETSNLLVCKNYMYLKIKLLDWCFFLFDLYALALLIYGLVFSSQLSLLTNGEPITGTLYVNCLAMAFGYIILNGAFQLTKNGADSHTKFLHMVFGVVKIIPMIGCIFVWFI